MKSHHRLSPEELRWRCSPERFPFESTAELDDCPIQIIGQKRAQQALALGLAVDSDGYNIFVTGEVGSGRSTVVRRLLDEVERGEAAPDDLVYVHNFLAPDQPRILIFPAGRGGAFRQAMQELLDGLTRDLPQLFDSERYREQRATMIEQATQEQKTKLKEFEQRVQEEGFALVQVEMGPLTRPQLVPVVAGNPVDMDQLESLVEEDKFKREEFEELRGKATRLRGEMESLGKTFRKLDRGVRRELAELDRKQARPRVEDALGDLRSEFDVDGLEAFLDQMAEDLLEHLDDFRRSQENPDSPTSGSPDAESFDLTRYSVNVVVDNSRTHGRPILWETSPNYRNLFGTIDKVRVAAGEWDSDHTRIHAGSLLTASGGFLVLDAMDVLVEPGVWAALKRTLRNRTVEMQAFDPFQILSGVSLKPEPAPIDVKVVMIGTRHIYRLLHALDEDFQKIFKVKAELARRTPLSDDELTNYACFVHKKVLDDSLPPFRCEAVAAVVEHGVRLAGHREKLTTRFAEIADLIRESGYWARQDAAEQVGEQHVDRAVEQRINRVNLIEEVLREQIAEGQVLLDLAGAEVGQVNGLAVLDVGDHVFAQPSRITATTAMGRAGIIDLDREAQLSGAIHTKGVLILTGFLRSRFAQSKPLALTASLSFEQNYGQVDGDSASSAELYALLSSLSGAPIRQGIAVTGSVNQRGEIQPIGGVNEKIEGFFDLCRIRGLQGEQGVMIPALNRSQLMLRKDVVEEVSAGRFHIFAVSTIEEGLEVLTGIDAGSRGENGEYPAESLLGRANTRLEQLVEQVGRFGPADTGHS